MNRRLICCSTLVFVIAFASSHATYAQYAIRVERNVSASMRDGVKLKVDIYRPITDGKFPVLLGRTPYGKQQCCPEIAEKLAKRGYIVAVQDVRGRGESEGKFDPFFDDEKDGYDSVEWASGLPQSNGKVGMILSSYGSASQLMAALAHPPHLVTIVAIQPAIGFVSHQIFFEGGAFRQLWAESWTALLAADSYSRTIHQFVADSPSLDGLMQQLPLGGFTDQLSRKTLEAEDGGYFREWLKNAPGGVYWDRTNLAKRVADIKVPGLYVGGWYDLFGPATVALFGAVQRNAGSELARTKSQLIVGPWSHEGQSDVNFGSAASIEIEDYQNQWLDYWLKGESNGVMSHPMVHLFLTGQNRWIDSAQWPLPGTESYRLFLSSIRSARSSSGDGVLTPDHTEDDPLDRPDDILVADPSDPIPTVGGKLCCLPAYPAGAHYQNQIEKRKDLLIYTATPLNSPMTIVGEPTLTLHIASDAPDIDLIVKLIDVEPDGKAWNVAEGALRLRYRNRTDQAEWLVHGKTYTVSIQLGPVAHSFLIGHSIRLQIAGSDFPNYSINLNMKEGILDGIKGRTAHTSIKYTPQFSSFLELPRLVPSLSL